ncbi:hypothetical protein [Mucilaginibacter sp. AK015]|uniref:hypothetical protein n=1 Tax=Mucilaginibacter sp. AK015 TaxID=2723072 RepID=UPI001620ECB6|nr:hypothetical protein [Mucilaginibacter sp. AK015]MBB5396347.1 hypothetical protein [Mucilaginibacter sp. AK015]
MGGSNQTVHTNGNGTGFDLSQKVKPDWPHATRYTRLGKDVIEMPICPDSKFKSILKKKINNQAYSKSYTRSSYLLLKDVKGYKAYIMTIVADSSYIKGDPGKLANNTYRQHDADFSGLVLYFTPKGKYLNGYAYKNGQLVESGSAVQSQGRTRVQLAERCIDWYYDVYVNGVFVGSIYLYTTCNTPNPQDPGSSGSPAPPNRCDTQGPLSPSTPNSPSTPSVPTALSGHVVVNNVPGGGFPPPTDEDDPCDNVPSSSLHPIFGINNSNAIIPDANFDDLLNYLDTKGISYSNPYNVTVTINGIQYKGQYTDIYNPDGTVVHYFSPDISSGPFQIGMEYAIGTSPVSSNTVNTTISMDFGAVRVGSPSSYLGNGTVTYAPLGGSGGALLTAAQRQQLESSDNSRLLQLLQQEDAADDAAAGPCHGTARNGNVKWPGTLEHWLIQFDYIASNPLSLKEYYVPGSSGKLNGNPGYADIANPVTGEMFEIKPDNTGGQSAGVAEIQLYVTKANALCPRVVGGGWSAGGNYPSRSLPDPKNPANLLISRLFSNGVIVYASKPRNGLPQPVPIVLPENLLEKLKKLFRQIKENPNNMQLQIIAFVRQNPKIIPYLKSAAAVVVIGTILEDIASDGAGVLDDWQSFLIARALWRVSNGIVII